MPKIVDQDARRTEIVGALRRVIQREGIAGASVRTVATEAGLSAGAMRHYFASQSELLGFALAAMTADVERRIVARVEAWRKGPPTLEGLVAVLEEVAPLDARRRVEFEVWLELVMLARTSPELRPLVLEAHRGVRRVCRQVVMAARGDVRTDAEGEKDAVVRRWADQLHGLLDGLSLHLAIYPGETSRARVRAALRTHLESVAVEQPGP